MNFDSANESVLPWTFCLPTVVPAWPGGWSTGAGGQEKSALFQFFCQSLHFHVDFMDGGQKGFFSFSGRVFQLPVLVEGAAHPRTAFYAAHGDEDVWPGNLMNGLWELLFFHIYMVEFFHEPEGGGVYGSFRFCSGGAAFK